MKRSGHNKNWWSMLSWNFFLPAKKSSKGARRRRFRPLLEALETRLAPAIYASIDAGGVLDILSDEQGAVFVRVVADSFDPGDGSSVPFFPITVTGPSSNFAPESPLQKNADNQLLGGTGPGGTLTINDISAIRLHGGQDNILNDLRVFSFSSSEPGGTKPIPVTILGGPGNDTLVGGSINGAKTIIMGEDGNDDLSGLDGDQELDGGLGNDRLSGGPGSDILRGGDDNDFLQDGTTNGDDGVDQFFGGPGDDVLETFAGVNKLDGGSGNDTYLYTRNAFHPFAVDDEIIEAPSQDTDTISFDNFDGFHPGGNPSNPKVGVTIDLSSTDKQTVVAGLINITLSNSLAIENVIGSPASDHITGNDRDNLLDGGQSTLSTRQQGLANKDTLIGGNGNDTLRSDFQQIFSEDAFFPFQALFGAVMEGGPGDDILISTFGDDILRGGDDSDTYRFDNLFQGHDTIEEAGLCQDTDTLDFTQSVTGNVSIPSFDFFLDLTNPDRQTVLRTFDLDGDGLKDPNLELTLGHPQAVEQARGDFGAGVLTIANPACAEPEADLQIRAAYEREQDFANDQRREQDPSGDQIETLNLPQTLAADFLVKVANTGQTSSTFTLDTEEIKPAGWTITYIDQASGDDITVEMEAGLFTTRLLAPGESQIIAIEMFADATVPAADKASTIISVLASEAVIDAVKAETVAALVVNSEDDASDPNSFLGGFDLDGVPDVDVNTPGLQTTLRAALQFANTVPLGVIPTILFADNVNTIEVGSTGNGPLPTITKAVALVGPQANPPAVTLRGTKAAANEHGLTISSTQTTTIANLRLENFGGHGILLDGGALRTEGILQSTGNGGDGFHALQPKSLALGSGLVHNFNANTGNGVFIEGQAADAAITIEGLIVLFGNGGDGMVLRDLSQFEIKEVDASGNTGNGIRLDTSANGAGAAQAAPADAAVKLLSNVDAESNGANGILIHNVSSVRITRDDQGESEISDNGPANPGVPAGNLPVGNGIAIVGANSFGITIDAAGLVDEEAGTFAEIEVAENTANGILVTDGAHDVTLGPNLDFFLNDADGVVVTGGATSVTLTGSTSNRNLGNGVVVTGGARDTTIEAIVADNEANGIVVSGAAQNTTIAESIVRGNKADGIVVSDGAAATFIGTRAVNLLVREPAPNKISGNDQAAIRIQDPTTGPTFVQSNQIGAFDELSSANGDGGIIVEDALKSVVIGGSDEFGNTIVENGPAVQIVLTIPGTGEFVSIANNIMTSEANVVEIVNSLEITIVENALIGETGVSVESIDVGVSADIDIRANNFDVARIAIDLVGGVEDANGATANDPAPDSDDGPNELQNFPVIDRAEATVGQITFLETPQTIVDLVLTGQLESAPGAEFLIEVYAADATGILRVLEEVALPDNVVRTDETTGIATIFRRMILQGLDAMPSEIFLTASRITQAAGKRLLSTSELSPPFPVTVAQDTDGDGVADQVEESLFDGDGNADGIPDAEQSQVFSVPGFAADPNQEVLQSAVTVVGGNPFQSVHLFDRSNVRLADGTIFPTLRLAQWCVAVDADGIAIVEVLNADELALYVKFDAQGNEIDFSFDAATGTGIQKTFFGTFEIFFKDGERGDSDGVKNGVICDPFAIIAPRADADDVDVDGVDSAIEDAAPNSGDGNNDGVPDSQQPEVASLPNANNGQYVTIAAAPGVALQNVAAVADPSGGQTPLPANVSFPVGFFNFSAAVPSPGGTLTVTLFLPPGVTANTFFKFGPEPGDPAPHFYEFLFDGTTGAELFDDDGNGSTDRVVLHLVDGGRGDLDGEENAQILDPGAVAFVPKTINGAGNVRAQVTRRGHVHIVGDKLGNAVRLEPGPRPNSVLVTGLDNTTVNGQPQVILDNFTRSMSISLKRGDDTLLLNNLIINSVSRIDLGSGNDVAEITATEFRGRFALAARTGDDQIDIVDSVFQGNGSQMDLGPGNNVVTITATEFRGRIALAARAGDDQIDIVDSVFQGKFCLSSGRGGDQVGITGSQFQSTATIALGSQDDALRVLDSIFASKVLFNLGAGANDLDAGLLTDSNGNLFAFDPKLRGRRTLVS